MSNFIQKCSIFNHRQAEIELRRDNHSYAIILLQTVANAAADTRTSLEVKDPSSVRAADSEWSEECGWQCKSADNQDGKEDDFLNYQRIPCLPRFPVGGLPSLVRFELRARIAMVCIHLFQCSIIAYPWVDNINCLIFSYHDNSFFCNMINHDICNSVTTNLIFNLWHWLSIFWLVFIKKIIVKPARDCTLVFVCAFCYWKWLNLCFKSSKI